MQYTENRLETHWELAKIFIVKYWPKFTEVELNRINGNFDSFLFYLNELYGGFPKTEAMARDKMQKFLNSLDDRLFTKPGNF